MTISAELIAIAILGVSLVSLGWKVTGDLRQEIHLVRKELRQEIQLVRHEVAQLGERIGNLEQRVGNLELRLGNVELRVGNLEQHMARLEGWIQGRFKEDPELKAKPATGR